MKELVLTIKAVEGIFTFKYSNTGEKTRKNVQELFLMFGDLPENKTYFVMTAEIKKRVDDYTAKHAKKFPAFYQFKIFINSISIGNTFLILDGELKNTNEDIYYN